MDREDAIIKGLREFRTRVNREIAIKKMIFFGSRTQARSHKDSDIDLIIVSDHFKNRNFIKRAAEMYDSWDLDYAVDFLCFTPEEFEKRSKQVSIVSEAIKEGIEIT